jgi:hypothetical protein
VISRVSDLALRCNNAASHNALYGPDRAFDQAAPIMDRAGSDSAS